jgi:hypothetical protein
MALCQRAEALKLPSAPGGAWQHLGGGEIESTGSGVVLQDGFMLSPNRGQDYQVSFSARAPAGTPEAQIWAGIRAVDRDHRYVFALRGGEYDELYLARYAPDGNAEFLGYAPLGFKPQPGVWYKLRAAVAGNRIQLYLGSEKLPRINVTDPHPLWNQGGIVLGGGWLPAEFANVHEAALTGDRLAAFNAIGDAVWTQPGPDKETVRAAERAAYKPVQIGQLGPGRTSIPLNGTWLFMPEQDLAAGSDPAAAGFPDQTWHTIAVPSFWNIGLDWLYGETCFSYLKGPAISKSIADNLTIQEYRRVNAQTFDWSKTRSGWYREYFELPGQLTGHEFELVFDAIAKVSDVWVNGVHVGSHTGMFGELQCDITKAVKPGTNVLAVRCLALPSALEHGSQSVKGVAVTVEVSDAMLNSLPHHIFPNEVGGIWQPVKLLVTSPVAVSGVYIRPALDGASVDVRIANHLPASQPARLSYRILSAADNSVLYSGSQAGGIALPANTGKTVTVTTPRLQPRLWSPSEPNLYRLELTLSTSGTVRDVYCERFGFRTFTVAGNRLLLNGRPYWLRGADHFPVGIRPNDPAVARRFLRIAHDGNVRITRTTGGPLTETWADAADEIGMGISFEGIWPWLMLHGPPPQKALLDSWKADFTDLVLKYRNHPSILIWTINNEMSFGYQDQNNLPELAQKWAIVTDMIRTVRKLDPTRPIIADSTYVRAQAKKGYEAVVKPHGFDDGDIDDAHVYYGWYDKSPFHLFDGIGFAKEISTPGRPLISQEMSTGYPQNDGHPTRFYLFMHSTPQASVGDEAWEDRDPAYFMNRQAFMTKEVAEVARRMNRNVAAGIMHFAYLTWITDPWDASGMKPKVTYYALKTALQPMLVSAELTGRHFYTDAEVRRRVCLINDSEQGEAMPAGTLYWEVRDHGAILAGGQTPTPAVPYYSNQWLNVNMKMPATLPEPRIDGQLAFQWHAGGKTVSENQYDVLLATNRWAAGTIQPSARLAFWSQKNGAALMNLPNVDAISSFSRLDSDEGLVIKDAAGLAANPAELEQFKTYVDRGGRALLLHPGDALRNICPEAITAFVPTPGEIVTMHIPESPVFDGIKPLDLSWFEMGAGKIPTACTGRYLINGAQPEVLPLADQCDPHGYLKKSTDIQKYSGHPLIEIHEGKGFIVASEMNLEAQAHDPVAGRLYSNLIGYLENPVTKGYPGDMASRETP